MDHNPRPNAMKISTVKLKLASNHLNKVKVFSHKRIASMDFLEFRENQQNTQLNNKCY